MKKLCIFDLDGTLINSLEDLADSVNYVLKKYGLAAHKVEQYQYFVGDGLRILIQRASAQSGVFLPDVQIDQMKQEFDRYYRSHLLHKTKPYEGILDLLARLKRDRLKTAVLSNKPDEFVQVIVPNLFPARSFDLVLGQSAATPRKPDPTGVLQILKATGAKKEETLYIGDSSTDIRTANNAGVFSIGVTWGFRPREELEANGASVIVDSPKEIYNYIAPVK